MKPDVAFGLDLFGLIVMATGAMVLVALIGPPLATAFALAALTLGACAFIFSLSVHIWPGAFVPGLIVFVFAIAAGLVAAVSTILRVVVMA